MLNPNILPSFSNSNQKLSTLSERININNRLQKAGNLIIGNEKNLKRPTNNLEPKTSSRFNKTNLIKNFNINSNKTQKNNKETYINKIPINLEDLLIQEEHL